MRHAFVPRTGAAHVAAPVRKWYSLPPTDGLA